MSHQVQWTNPYADDTGAWYQGNLHCHSTGSDGKLTPRELSAFYVEKGLDFMGLTDHQVVTPVSEYARPDLVCFAGVEPDFKGRYHMGIIAGPGKSPEFTPVFRDDGEQQSLLSANTAAGHLTLIHHPDWLITEHYGMDRLMALTDYLGLEVYNALGKWAAGSHWSGPKWDRLLAKGRRVLGFASQDLHAPENWCRGHLAVRAAAKTPEAIWKGLMTGNFTGDCGVRIESIGRKGDTLFVEAPEADLIRFVGTGGAVVGEVPSHSARFTFEAKDTSRIVRVECLGPRGGFGFSQPFFREEDGG